MYFLRECQPFSLPISLFDTVTAAMSPARMAPYLNDANHEPSLAIRRYRWNLLLVEALTAPMSFAEVFARNAIHATLERNLRRQWLSCVDPSLAHKTRQIIKDAEVAITEKNLQHSRPYVPTVGQLIAAMTFGFWHFMSAPRYHNILWRNTLGVSFPYAPAGARPGALFNIMTRLLDARNRIAHHEPIIWKNPEGIYNDCLTLIEWIAGEPVKLIVGDMSGFGTVLAARPV